MIDSSWRQFLTSQGAHWDNLGVQYFGEEIFPWLEQNQPLLADLSHWSVLQLQGIDARKFLQGQVTCDMANVTDKHWQRGATCNVKGRALFSFYCLQIAHPEGEAFLLLLPSSTVNLAHDQLKKYAVFSKVSIQICTNYNLIGLLDHASVIANSFKFPANEKHTIQHSEPGPILQLTDGQFLCLIPTNLAQATWQVFSSNCTLAGYPAWTLACIRAGIAQVEEKTSAEFVPQLLNFHLTEGISFSKGCYLGQEVVARMAYRGTLKRHLRRALIHCEQVPMLNDAIYSNNSEQSIGNVVSAVKIDSDSIEVLAVVTDQAFDDDTAYLDLQKSHKLHFLSLPYAITK